MNDKKITARAEDVAYDGIIALIMKGVIKPGDRLVEQQVGDALKISRTPVRNAMRTLASEGLLQNRGTGGYLLPKLSLKDLNELCEVRFIFEPDIAEHAAMNADDSLKNHFYQLIETERQYYLSGEVNLYKINREIHEGIAALTGNEYMLLLLERIYWRQEMYTLFFDTFYRAAPNVPLLRDPDLSHSHREHAELIHAIFDHDTTRARKTMLQHIMSTWLMLKKNIFASRNGFGGTLISDWDVKLKNFSI